MKLVLYDYYRSSASYRVRIGLNLKGAAYERVPVNLLEGEQKDEAYRARNPQGFVPMLEVDGRRLTQSLAILTWLDVALPEPPLLPAAPVDQSYVRSLALTIAADIHPLNNLRVLKRLADLGIDQAARDDWYRQWIREGFDALEALAAPRAGRFLSMAVPASLHRHEQAGPVRLFPVLDRLPGPDRAQPQGRRL